MDEKIAMIMRQTDYTQEISVQKLADHNNDVMQVIRAYMQPLVKEPLSTSVTAPSVNQQRYKEIRRMMDDAARTYEYKKTNEREII